MPRRGYRRCSHDVICLFNGRASIVAEISASEQLREFLADKFSSYLAEPDLIDAVEGFVQTEGDSETRKKVILDRFRAVAGL